MRIKFIDEMLKESKQQESSVKNSLVVMLLHMLKCKYQFNYQNKSSWRDSILNSYEYFINEFDGIGKGSLYKNFYMRKMDLDQIYQLARRRASYETKLPLTEFPAKCEWSKELLVNIDFVYDFINEFGYGTLENK